MDTSLILVHLEIFSRQKMLSWIRSDSEATTIAERNQGVLQELNQLVERKLLPIRDEYMFTSLHDSRPSSKFPDSMPHVSVIGDSCAFTSSVLQDLLGSSPVVTSELVVYCGESFLPYASSMHGVRVVSALDTFSVVSAPFELSKHVIVQSSSIVLLVFDIEKDGVLELVGPIRAAIKSLRTIVDRVRIIVNSQTNLLPFIWQLSKLLPLPELIKIYVMSPSVFPLLGCELNKIELYRDIITNVDIWLVRRLEGLVNEARTIRAHAALMATIKSQLPLIYGQESKLSKILENIEMVFPSAASKFKVPLSDFNRFLDDTFISRLRLFDFRQIKKVKDASFEKIAQFIDTDMCRLLHTIPKHDTHVTVPARLLRPPNLREYLEDFQSLGPDGGTVGGPLVRDHLVGISRLDTHLLHKVWKLADISKDGKLSLFEYSLCRELIQLVNEGDILPLNLPMTVFEH